MRAKKSPPYSFILIFLLASPTGLLLAYPSPFGARSASAISPQCPGGGVPPCPTTTPKSKPRTPARGTTNRTPKRGATARTPPRQATCVAQSPTSATGNKHSVEIGGGLKLEMVEIPAGSFCMGSADGDSDERPVHRVTIGRAFYMGVYEVTQAQWGALMGNNPSEPKCNDCPVVGVSWLDAQAFLKRLNERNDEFEFRLPSEAEWEYAARAGTTTAYAFGNTLSQAQAHIGHPTGASARKPMPVGSFRANAFGLYDMHGNAQEWCEDHYQSSYEDAPADGSAWLNRDAVEGYMRVLRGGAWTISASRSADRNYQIPDMRQYTFGFRVAAVPRP